MMLAALKFFLGQDEVADADSDDEDGGGGATPRSDTSGPAPAAPTSKDVYSAKSKV